jgi:hypothetical protein
MFRKNYFGKGIFLTTTLSLITALSLAITGCTSAPKNITPTSAKPPITTNVAAQTLAIEFYRPNSKIPVRFDNPKLSQDYPTLEGNISKSLPELYALVKDAYNVAATPDGVSELTVISVSNQYTLPGKESLEEKISTAKKTIDDMRTYVSGANLSWPEVKFVVPNSITEIEEGAEPKDISNKVDKISIYPVQDFSAVGRIKGFLNYGKRVIPLDANVEAESNFGVFLRNVTFTATNNTVETIFTYGNIIWKVGAEPQNVLETPAQETLHVALSQITMQNTKDTIGGIQYIEDAERIVNNNLRLEEYVVHGIGHAWFKEINKTRSLGYDTENFVSRPGVSSWWKDENVINIERLVKEKGSVYVLRLYKDSPEKLMTEASIVLK